MAKFAVTIDGDEYSGTYKGITAIAADKKSGLKKFAATGFSELAKNGNPILTFQDPVDIYVEKINGKTKIMLADKTNSMVPLINQLQP